MGKHKPIYDPSTDCGDYVVEGHGQKDATEDILQSHHQTGQLEELVVGADDGEVGGWRGLKTSG